MSRSRIAGGKRVLIECTGVCRSYAIASCYYSSVVIPSIHVVTSSAIFMLFEGTDADFAACMLLPYLPVAIFLQLLLFCMLISSI